MTNPLTMTAMQRLADLANLDLSETELMRYRPHLANILSLAKEMITIETDNIPPAAHPFESTQRLRTDFVTESNHREIYQTIAPQTEAGFYLVPPVIE
jgi:aspartyl-tRNA(Asn)/glutamyl-tRNA(Gln) amidotransferase subunit C